jgi:hypothetical protein
MKEVNNMWCGEDAGEQRGGIDVRKKSYVIGEENGERWEFAVAVAVD